MKRGLLFIAGTLIVVVSIIYGFYWLSSTEETFVPEIPKDVEYISIEGKGIYNKESYIVSSKDDIESVIHSLDRVSEHVYDGEPAFVISFICDGSCKYRLPMKENSSYDYPSKAVDKLRQLANLNNKSYTYNFLVTRKTDFKLLKEKLKNEDVCVVYYPKPDLCYQHPSIRLTYKDEVSKYKRYKFDDFMNKTPLGRLPSDNIFKPIIEMLESKSLVYSYSDVQFCSGSNEEFCRSITIYLKDEITDSGYSEIKNIWKPREDLHNSGVGEPPIEYNKAKDYEIKIIIKKQLKQQDFDYLKKQYNIIQSGGE